MLVAEKLAEKLGLKTKPKKNRILVNKNQPHITSIFLEVPLAPWFQPSNFVWISKICSATENGDLYGLRDVNDDAQLFGFAVWCTHHDFRGLQEFQSSDLAFRK